MRDLRTLAGHYFSATPKPESFSLKCGSFHDPRRLTVGPMPDLGSHRFQKVSSTRRTPVDVAAARRSYAPECGGSRFAAAAPARFFQSSFSACDHVAYRLIQPGARAGGSAWRASHGHRPTAEARPNSSRASRTAPAPCTSTRCPGSTKSSVCPNVGWCGETGNC
jgi:hypothetical protein